MRVLTALLLLAVGSTPAAVVPASPMSAPRAAHSATLLRSGEVLIAGGCAVDGCERDARGAETELFDPATGRFRAGPRLQRPRVGHAAFRLPDGRVVIAGGWQGADPTAGTEIYNPARDSIAAGAAMTTPRGGFTVTPLGRGRFLVAGGSDGRRVLASAEIFDAASMRFRRTGSMGSPRDAHAAAPLGRGRVLVTGGRGARDVVLSKTEVYDAQKGRFARGPAMTTNRYKHAAVSLGGGAALVVGGSDSRDFNGRYASAERYDPRTRRFRRVGAMAERRFKLTDAVVRLPSGRVLVAGGGARVEVYEPATRRFRAAGRVGATLASATATVLRDGRVLVAGGYDDSIRVSREAWVFTP
ncbi:MAG TPA: kelch repeat-containing protein [Gaiellaceae bacterium]|nr:kelch repeat-containing protein [Gaiellaceae bacterium]